MILIETIGGHEYPVTIEQWSRRNGQIVQRRVRDWVGLHRKRYRIANRLAYGKGALSMYAALEWADRQIRMAREMRLAATWMAVPQRWALGISGVVA